MSLQSTISANTEPLRQNRVKYQASLITESLEVWGSDISSAFLLSHGGINPARFEGFEETICDFSTIAPWELGMQITPTGQEGLFNSRFILSQGTRELPNDTKEAITCQSNNIDKVLEMTFLVLLAETQLSLTEITEAILIEVGFLDFLSCPERYSTS